MSEARFRKGLCALVALAVGLAAAPGWAQRGGAAAPNATIASGGNAPTGYDMAPETNETVVKAAVAAIPDKIPAGPFAPTWDSLKANYQVPQWFQEAKFGIFMHWGLYTVPAYSGGGAAEWYETHLYAGGATLPWHTQQFGPLTTFGYKDFIPLFKAEKFDPDAWALLFKKAGAKFVVPTGQHHDNFSMWDSKVNPINAKAMGPKRDLIGDLSKAVRAQGLKFGISNHGIEAFQFVKPNAQVKAQLQGAQADVYDPKWKDFYNAADRSDAACQRFLVNWARRNVELIDQYQPDMLWFDNGVDIRYLDSLKLWIAAYYYNRAVEWKKEVSISTKKAAYAPDGDNIHTIGSIIDFEKIGSRSPAGIRTGAWQVDDPIGSQWGYAEGMTVASAASLVGRLINVVSQNGTLLLNISPRADGTIPDNQQQSLLGLGEWLGVNGEAIYGTHNWIKFQDAGGGGRGAGGNIRFTVKGEVLYAIVVGTYPATISIASLAQGQAPQGTIKSVTMLGSPGELKFTQDAGGLHVTAPATPPCKIAYALKITGLKMNADTATKDGNPILP